MRTRFAAYKQCCDDMTVEKQRAISEAKEIIELYDAPQGEAHQLQVLLDKLADKRLDLEAKRRDADAALANMDDYAARCRDRLSELENGG